MTMNRLSYGTKSAAGGGLQPVAQAALARTCRSRSRLIKLVIQDIRPITQTQIADDLQRVLGSWGRFRAKKPGNDELLRQVESIAHQHRPAQGRGRRKMLLRQAALLQRLAKVH